MRLRGGFNSRSLQYGSLEPHDLPTAFETAVVGSAGSLAPSSSGSLGAFTSANAVKNWADLESALSSSLDAAASSTRSTSSSVTPEAQSAVPVAQADQPRGSAPASSAYITRLWKGDIPLPMTYWFWGFTINAVFTVIFASVRRPSPGLTLFYYAYYVFMIVAIWRSSERYTGAKVWGVLARVSVMLGLIRTVVALALARGS